MNPNRLCRALTPRMAVRAMFCATLAALFARPAQAQDFVYPLAVAAGEKGAWVVDLDLPGVWRIEDGNATVYFQADKKLRSPLNRPRGIALDREGRVLVADTATRQIYRMDGEGSPQPLVTSKAGIGTPMGIAVNSAGEIYVADLELKKIFKVPGAGGEATVVAEVDAPRALAMDSSDRLWILSQGKDQVFRLQADGKLEPVVKGQPFKFPGGIAVDGKGVAFVTDNYGKTIWRIEPNAEPQAWVQGEPLKSPVGIAVQGDSLLVADPHAKAVFEITAEGHVNQLVGAPSAP